MRDYDVEAVDRLPFTTAEKSARYRTENYQGAVGLNWYTTDPTLQAAMANVSPAVRGTPAQSAPSVASPAGTAVSKSSTAGAAPVAVPMSQVRALAMEAATGDALIGQGGRRCPSQGFAWAVTVLALAPTLPLDRVTDWAGTVGAHPVSVDPRIITPRPRRQRRPASLPG